MSTKRKNFSEHSADEFLKNHSLLLKIESICEKNYDSHMPFVLATNVGISTILITIVVSHNPANIIVKISTLLAVAVSLILFCLNLWFIFRQKKREEKFKEERGKIRKRIRSYLVRAFDLFASTIDQEVGSKAKVLLQTMEPGPELLKKFDEIMSQNDSKFVVDKGSFIFEALNMLSLYETIYQNNKCMDSPLPGEKYSHINLLVDRISTKLKHSSVLINVILVLLTLLIRTF